MQYIIYYIYIEHCSIGPNNSMQGRAMLQYIALQGII